MIYVGSLPLSSILYGVGGIIGFFLLVGILSAILKVELPNKLMVITGRKSKLGEKTFGFSVQRGRTAVVPYLQSKGTLDMEIIPINVRVDGVNSANGISVGADATACVCIDDDDEGMIYASVERLMGKSTEQIKEQVKQTLIGNFRGALNKATPLEAIGMTETNIETDASQAIDQGERAQFRAELVDDINSDLSSFGMKVVSVSLQKIWDGSNYIGNLAQKTLASKRKEVEIREAELRADAEKAESDSAKRIEVAKSEADRKIVAAQEALEVYRREAEALIDRTKREAVQRVATSENRGQTQVQKVKNELQKLLNQSKVTLEESARQKAAEIIASGEQEAVAIKEGARNRILSQKAEILKKMGTGAKAVLFIQQQLPHLYKAYQDYAKQMGISNYLILDDEDGFNKAVNRGPKAFADFVSEFERVMGMRIKDYLSSGADS